jgi:LuxR family transcriptional regulator, maltose regulon positive regulatory protein
MVEKLMITRTKIITPQRRKDYLSRKRLLEVLSDLLDYRLIIIAAPAGYGKTSLLVDFAHQFEWPVCWFALEPIDRDFTRFLSHFIYAIRQQFPDFGDEAITLLENTASDQINTDFLITTITNDIFNHITEHFIIVLDDYHLLQTSPKIDQFLSDFIQRADENCHIAVTSRKLLTLPDLPLMVARSQVGGLSAEELAFQHDEILKLFHQTFNRPITSTEAKALARSTEGWITGLLLTSKTLRSGMGAAENVARTSGIGLYEYLAQQVLEQQPQDVQDFLLNSSILEEFDSDMCSAVIGEALDQDADWPGFMNHIVQNNLFYIPVREDTFWLRYHHLFRDFLQASIEKTRPHDAKRIRIELAEFHKIRGDFERVFEIYQNLGDKQAVAALIREIGSAFIAKGKLQKLDEWLREIPEEFISGDAILLSLRASVEVNRGQIQHGCDLLDEVVSICEENGDAALLADNLIRRSSARRFLGNYEDALEDAERAIEITARKHKLSHLYSEALRTKGITLYQQGKLRDGLTFLEKAIRICQASGKEEDRARIQLETGAIHETLGEFDQAEAAYSHALAYWQAIGDSIWQPIILNNLGVLQHSKGDLLNSFFNLEKAMHYSQQTGNQRMEGYALASIGDLYRDLRALNEAEDAYQKALEIALIIEDQFLIFYLKTVQARVSVMNEQLKKAQLQIRAAQSIAKKSGSLYEMNKYRLEQGMLYFWQSEYAKALESFKLPAEFFRDEGHLEDAVRTQFYLFLTMQKIGKVDQALTFLQQIRKNINEPKYHIPSMSAANEMQSFLCKLARRKEYAGQLSELINALSSFHEEGQKSRLTIRKHASVVPFAPARISIRTFGTIEIYSQNRALTNSDWMTQTSRDLFLLFLANPMGLTKGEVGLILWPDASSSELKLRFKNAIYRMRHAIGSDVVLFQDNIYMFNRAVDHDYDVQTFISAIKIAREEKQDMKKIKALSRAVAVYKGEYLPSLDEEWVILDREKYKNMYIQAAEELAELYLKLDDVEKTIQAGQNALDEDPYYEPLHRIIMQAYAIRGDRASVSRQYEKCRKMLMDGIGLEPSEQTDQLFRDLIA